MAGPLFHASGDALHRTGAIYSLAPASGVSKKAPGEWQTMIITLLGLQNHDPGELVWFKEVNVRPLPPSVRK